MSTASAVAYPLTIYYDGACPICATEMTTLKRHDVGDRLILRDCANRDGSSVSGESARDGGRDDGRDDVCRAAGITLADLGARIHARDAAGRWLVGVDVFVVAYDAAGFALLATLFAHPRLRPSWDRLYPWVARHRYALSRLGLQHAFRLLPHRARRAAIVATGGTRDCAAGTCRRAAAADGRDVDRASSSDAGRRR